MHILSVNVHTYVYGWGFLIQMAAAGSVINGSGVYRAQCKASERATCAAALILKPAAVLFSSPSAPCIHKRARTRCSERETHPFVSAHCNESELYLYMSAFMMFLLLTHSVDSTLRIVCVALSFAATSCDLKCAKNFSIYKINESLHRT